MNEAVVLLFVTGALAVTAVARHWDLPAPLLLVTVGLGVSLVPVVPTSSYRPRYSWASSCRPCCSPRPTAAPTRTSARRSTRSCGSASGSWSSPRSRWPGS
ncbi:hypothetical protein NKG05_21625 [Oerskovia sp. M15]